MRMVDLLFVGLLTFLCVALKANGQNIYNSYKNGKYQSYPVDQSTPSTCNDLRCNPNECCVETHMATVCVALVTVSTGQAFCARYKKCSNLGHCPAGAPCCVQALEPKLAKTCPRPHIFGPGYGSIYDNSFTSSYGYDDKVDETNLNEGYCQARASTGGLCFSPLPGSETYNCPCTAPDTCKIALGPLVAGLCTSPTTTTTTTTTTPTCASCNRS
ncbi:hypothetical protein BgiBS90_036563 [Biomphalaria glabrata]|nr:hypothetical protein BgiBS90_036563 [Biomphalaria glabrata]